MPKGGAKDGNRQLCKFSLQVLQPRQKLQAPVPKRQPLADTVQENLSYSIADEYDSLSYTNNYCLCEMVCREAVGSLQMLVNLDGDIDKVDKNN